MRGLAALMMVLASACGPAQGDGADKRARIDEMYAEYRSEFPEVAEVEVDELAAELAGERPPVLVDVRSDEERSVSIIPGAISREEYESRRGELDDRSVVTYCTIGYRSGLYADELRRQGVDVRNLRGSILAWTHGGGELVDGAEVTRKLHVYGRQWDLAAEGFETVW